MDRMTAVAAAAVVLVIAVITAVTLGEGVAPPSFPPTATTVAPPLSVADAVLQPLAVTDVRTAPACSTVEEPSGARSACVRFGDGSLLAIAGTDASGAVGAVVLRGAEGAPGAVEVVLATPPVGPAVPGAYVGVELAVADVSGDGNDDAVFLFRQGGSGGILAVDVVEAPGEVTLHLDVEKGQLRAGDGRIDAYSALFGPDDPNCCPSSYRHDVVRRLGGAWRVVSSDEVPPTALPSNG